MTNLITQQQTMSSKEIAELTGKRHDHVLVDIRKMLSEIGSPEKSGQYKDSTNRTLPMILLDKNEALCLVSGYNVKMRMAIIKRWQELESKNEIDFSNPIQLRDLLLENVNKVIKLQETVSSQESAIQSLESHFKDGMTVVEFCKQLNGVNVNAVNKFLSSKKWLHYDNQWRVSSYARDNYLTEISTAGYENSKGETIPTFKVVLLKNGVKRLFAMYLDGLLPMKSTWDRKFCHIKI